MGRRERVTLYVHRGKEANFDVAADLGLSEKASQSFKYALYELGVDVEVDVATGKTRVLGVEGTELKTPGAWS